MKRKPPEGNVRRVQAIDRNVRYTITNKSGQTQQCESHLERRLALRLHRDKSIRDYRSQPETIYFIDDEGKRHRYTPDFQAWTISGSTQIHKVTIPERHTENPHSVVHEKFGRQLYAARGWQYFNHFPHTLPNDTETANLLGFYAFRAECYCNISAQQSVMSLLHNEISLPITILVDNVYAKLTWTGVAKPFIYATVFHLIWHDEIRIDWSSLFFVHGAPARGVRVWLNR